jgi:hypothetical protein
VQGRSTGRWRRVASERRTWKRCSASTRVSCSPHAKPKSYTHIAPPHTHTRHRTRTRGTAHAHTQTHKLKHYAQNLFDRVSRSYEREGPLQVCTNIATRRFESRYFFLFDDIMVHTPHCTHTHTHHRTRTRITAHAHASRGNSHGSRHAMTVVYEEEVGRELQVRVHV